MPRCTTDTCCLTLPLKLEKWQEDRLFKRFEIARQLYNTLACAEIKKIRLVQQSQPYIKIQEELQTLDRKTNSKQFNKLLRQRDELMRKEGFTEFSFKSDMKKYYKHFNDNIASNVAIHCIAAQVWAAFNQLLFEKAGKHVHLKKRGEIRSLRGYSAANGKSGGSEIIFRGSYVEWKGLQLPIKRSPDNPYEEQMLRYRVKYVRLLRKPGRTKDHWYAQLSLEGKPVVKWDCDRDQPRHPVGHGAVGLDIGPQTLAYAANHEANLVELADQVQNIEQEKCRLQRQMDRSRRSTNPENYHEDGTIKRGVKLTHNRSRRYLKLQRKLSYLQFQQAETRKRQHNELANHLLSLGDCFYVEDMAWPALAHRAKKTEISEKTGKFKRKKRFGKSIANKAPATLISILRQKCNSLEITGVVEVPTSVKASQYNHQLKEYAQKPLSQRWNDMQDGKKVQRDLYSAFLLQHYDPQSENFDQELLEQDYAQFIVLHDHTIQRLTQMPKTPSSMGIRRSVSSQKKPV